MPGTTFSPSPVPFVRKRPQKLEEVCRSALELTIPFFLRLCFFLMLLIFIKVLLLLMTIIMFFYKHNRTLFDYSYALGDRT